MTTVLQVNDVTKRYGPHVVLDKTRASFAVGQKVGVIGRNGAGKSTLIRIIIGDDVPDEGTVVRHPSLRMGYLEQHAPYHEDETAAAFLSRYADVEEWRAAKGASRFDMSPDLLQKRISELSEGYRMRVRLTGILLRDPNFLVLDEPTNYLDLRTQLLLEAWLRDFRGGFLVVSHDREFLKNTCLETLDVERGKTFLFPRPIEDFLAYKEQRTEEIERENRKIDAKKRHLQTFVDRFRFKASKASQAQSKIKQIARLTRIEIEHPIATARISIPAPKIKKGVAVSCENLSIGYPGRVVADGITFDLERGRHYAVLGDNGQGKTTFLNTLAGAIETLGGNYKWGADLKVAYYGERLFRAMDAHDKVGPYLSRQAAAGVLPEEVFRMAGNFLFSQDDLENKIETLSGGERARLCLAGLLLSGSTVFLLDEPTNHLDFESVEALGNALREYPGTILFVSHNRTFVNLVATAIIEVGGGKVRGFSGTYEEYVYSLGEQMHLQNGSAKGGTVSNARARGDDPSGPTPGSALVGHDSLRNRLNGGGPEGSSPDEAISRSRAEVHEDLKRQKRLLKQIEERVAEYESEKIAVLAKMALNPTVYSPGLGKRLKELSDLITEGEDEWFRVRQGIEWLEKE